MRSPLSRLLREAPSASPRAAAPPTRGRHSHVRAAEGSEEDEGGAPDAAPEVATPTGGGAAVALERLHREKATAEKKVQDAVDAEDFEEAARMEAVAEALSSVISEFRDEALEFASPFEFRSRRTDAPP